MPNHTTTLIKIQGPTARLAQFVREMMPKEENGCRNLDFNKIIPEPEKPEDCDPRFVVMDAQEAKDRCLGWDENNPKRWFDWYHWHIEYWGTKWNSYDATYPEPEEIEADELDEIKIWLYTAWCPATPVYGKLQRMFEDLAIDVYYADEGGFFVGHLHNDGFDECYQDNYGKPGPREICDELGETWLYEDLENEDGENDEDEEGGEVV